MTVLINLGPLKAQIENHIQEKYTKPKEYIPSYGTAGFRDEASKLAGVMYRCGLLIAARSLVTAADTGIVITASHNPERDNGVKLVEPDGSMLCADWEDYANRLAAADTAGGILGVLQDALAGCNAQLHSTTVLVGHDTRKSSPPLAEAATAGAALLCKVEQHGLVTTPELHWMVRQRNAGLPCAEPDYIDMMTQAFQELTSSTPAVEQPLYLDCANGVGAQKLAAMGAQLAEMGLTVELRNTGQGVLNEHCGSDFVQKEKQLPQNFQDAGVCSRCASIDGDADRLLYFTPQAQGGLLLLDGDRIAALAAIVVMKLLKQLPGEAANSFKVGIVQTAYANGSSTTYLTETLGCEVACTPTGVKYLHHEAVKFDVGIYFEANGHGTVLFGKQLLTTLQELRDTSTAAKQLLALSRLINQAVGDAISGVLMVEAALRLHGGTDSLTWWGGLYADLPSRQSKVVVPDRTAIKTTDAERRVSEPAALQEKVDELVAKFPKGRAFVRPSGTEDIVRVYAEAETQGQADELASQIGAAVKELLG